jgi:hypothetical protein
MDRYGNVKTAQSDSVYLDQTGATATPGPAAVLVAGAVSQTITYTDYGTSILSAVGKRLIGAREIPVAGVLRTWIGGLSTDWHTDGNWSPAAEPMSLDSVYIPAAATFQPAVAQSVEVGGVELEDVATITLGSFGLTASANVRSASTTGGIIGPFGRVTLTGSGMTASGLFPGTTVSGSYTINSNTTIPRTLSVDGGGVVVAARRLRLDSHE